MRVKIVSANEAIIYHKGGAFLQSYNTIVAEKKVGENPILYKDWDYSKTTMRHVNGFLSDVFKKHITKKEIIKLVKENKITIVDAPCEL